MDYNFKQIESKWQNVWYSQNTFAAKQDYTLPKFFCLVEFPYPSGQGLHVGHPRSYTALDIVARKKRLQGYNVLYPMGWDAFGLPTENFAIKNHIHPEVVTKNNVAHFKSQLQSLGFSFDWEREINTTDPSYYKWTQWIFLQLFKKGLAYKKEMAVNWCTSCKCVLANEEVVNGVCERCGSEVIRKNQSQWMLKITEYAQRLVDDLDDLDFIDRVKVQQKNWIGRSTGAEVDFGTTLGDTLTVYTTRPDTLFGATYMVVSPEAVNYWGPVDWYNGGMEHTTLHLLYSRFWHKFLYDIGVVPTKEPYAKRTSHGMILGENGEKMSKSRGNVVNPDEIVDQYGADTMRLYEMFIGDFEKAAPWNSDSIKGCKRFLERFWNLQENVKDGDAYSPELEAIMHKTIKKVTEDIDNLKCNTAIAAMMSLVNETASKGINKAELKTLTILLNPFAPHITEEMWQVMNFGGMVNEAKWPEYDEEKTKESTVEIALQIMGKVRSRITVPVDITKEDAIALAKADEKIAAAIEGKTIKKEIYVPGKLVNIVAV